MPFCIVTGQHTSASQPEEAEFLVATQQGGTEWPKIEASFKDASFHNMPSDTKCFYKTVSVVSTMGFNLFYQFKQTELPGRLNDGKE